jgi:hypothetical protein
MKFVIANLITFGTVATVAIWPIWSILEVNWVAKVAMTLAVFVAVGFFEERLLSGLVNRLVSKLFPDQNSR